MAGSWSLLGAGVGAWTACFVVVRALVPHKRSHDFCNRCVSFVHALVAIALSMLSVGDWRDPLRGIAGPSSPLQMRAIIVSLAYFVYDLGCGLLDSPVDYTNAVHHLLTILGLAYGFVREDCGTELLACLWLMELSNPCMHLRELLKEVGVRETKLNLANDLAFVILFTFARMVIGPYVTLLTISGQSPLAVKIGAIGIQVVSAFWFYKIMRMVYFKLFMKKKNVKKV